MMQIILKWLMLALVIGLGVLIQGEWLLLVKELKKELVLLDNVPAILIAGGYLLSLWVFVIWQIILARWLTLRLMLFKGRAMMLLWQGLVLGLGTLIILLGLNLSQGQGIELKILWPLTLGYIMVAVALTLGLLWLVRRRLDLRE